jgi:hypothetical protein
MIREVKQMAFIIYLICCAANGALMNHLGISLAQWEYWAFLALPIVSFICGRAVENNDTE